MKREVARLVALHPQGGLSENASDMAEECHMLLVVGDDPLVLRSIAHVVHRNLIFRIMEAESIAIARIALGNDPIGVIIDLDLPDGDGLELAKHARIRLPTTPILLITGSDEARYVNRAHLLGAAIVRKPDLNENLFMFVDHIVSESWKYERNLAYAIEQLVFKSNLSPQQRRIIELMLSGTTRAQLASSLGVEETTVRTHVRGIVRRVGVPNLDRVGWRLLQLLDTRLRRNGRDS